MNTNIKRGIVTGAISLSLLGGSAAGVVAQNQGNQGNQGGAAGLVAAVVQAQLDDTVNVEVVDSLNNLTALNNILNNSPILSGTEVTVGDISILDDAQIDVLTTQLENSTLTLDDVVGVAVLSGGDIIAIV